MTTTKAVISTKIGWIDYNRQNLDGQVLLDLPITINSLNSLNLVEDELVVLTDGEARCLAQIVQTNSGLVAHILFVLY